MATNLVTYPQAPQAFSSGSLVRTILERLTQEGTGFNSLHRGYATTSVFCRLDQYVLAYWLLYYKFHPYQKALALAPPSPPEFIAGSNRSPHQNATCASLPGKSFLYKKLLQVFSFNGKNQENLIYSKGICLSTVPNAQFSLVWHSHAW